MLSLEQFHYFRMGEWARSGRGRTLHNGITIYAQEKLPGVSGPSLTDREILGEARRYIMVSQSMSNKSY